MQNIIACRPGSFAPYHDRAYEAMQRLHIENVEISTPLPTDLSTVEDELSRYGLKVTSVSLCSDNGDPDFFDRAAETIRGAAALGAPVIFSSQKAGNTPREEVYARLSRLGDMAAEREITIALETHPDLCVNSHAALETMEGVRHPNIRINFDPANIHYYNQNVDAARELEAVAPYVRAVHLKDSNGGFQVHHFPAIGDGVVDWKSIFRILNDRGMVGPFTLEMEGIAGESLTFEETCARVQKSLEFLKSSGLMG